MNDIHESWMLHNRGIAKCCKHNKLTSAKLTIHLGIREPIRA